MLTLAADCAAGHSSLTTVTPFKPKNTESRPGDRHRGTARGPALFGDTDFSAGTTTAATPQAQPAPPRPAGHATPGPAAVITTATATTSPPHRKRIPTPAGTRSPPAQHRSGTQPARTYDAPQASPEHTSGDFSTQWCLQIDRAEPSDLPGEPPRGQQSAVRCGPRVAVEDHRLDQGSHGLEISTAAHRVETPACAGELVAWGVLGSPSLAQNSTAKSLDAGESRVQNKRSGAG